LIGTGEHRAQTVSTIIGLALKKLDSVTRAVLMPPAGCCWDWRSAQSARRERFCGAGSISPWSSA
jgi:hypothetical protein